MAKKQQTQQTMPKITNMGSPTYTGTVQMAGRKANGYLAELQKHANGQAKLQKQGYNVDPLTKVHEHLMSVTKGYVDYGNKIDSYAPKKAKSNK